MQTTKREHALVLIEQMAAQPHRYRFHQLINLLLRILRQQGVSYDQALRQVLRFHNSLSLAFPASEVESMQLEAARDDEPGQACIGRIHIAPSFISLLGAGGTLPLHDTERMLARASLGESSWKPFLDLLIHRVVCLFHEAWGKYRVEHGMNTRGHDTLLPLLSAIGGLRVTSSDTAQSLSVLPREVAAYYAGLLGTRPISALTVEQVLADYFGIPIRLEQFVGAWACIPDRKRSTLGVNAPSLGHGTVLGTRSWRRDQRVRLHLGPLDQHAIESLLPSGSAHAALRELASLFAVPSIEIELRLILKQSCLKPFTIASRTSERRRLGLNTFLTIQPGKASRADVRAMLQLRPDAKPS